MTNCSRCNAENTDDATVCAECGVLFSAETTPSSPPPPPPPPRPRTPYTSPADSAEVVSDKSSISRNQLLKIGGGIVALFVLVAMVYGIAQLFGGRGGKHVVIGLPDRGGEFELFAVKPGDSIDDLNPMAEDVSLSSVRSGIFVVDDVGLTDRLNDVSGTGGFLPGTNEIILLFRDDDELTVQHNNVNRADGVKIFDSESDALVTIFSDSETVAVTEFRDDEMRCYVADFGAEVERVAKGTSCSVMADNSIVLVTEEDADEYTLSSVNFKNGDEVTLLELDVSSPRVVPNNTGDLVAYVESGGGEQLFLVSNGEQNAVSDNFFSIRQFGFANRSDTLFYIAETVTGSLTLYTTRSSEPLAEGAYLQAALTDDGAAVVYVVGDEIDEMSVFVAETKSGKQTEVLSGEQLQFALIEAIGRIVIVETTDDGDLTIYSSDIDGKNVATLFDNEMTLEGIFYTQSGNNLYFHLWDGEKRSLYAAPTDGDDGFMVVDEFSYYKVQQVSDDEQWLVYSAQEDSRDDTILYSANLAKQETSIELDDDSDDIINAVLSRDGKTVLYTASTGSDSDDVTINEVSVDGDDNPEVLYDEARLLAAQWSSSSEINGAYLAPVLTSSSPCPGAPELTTQNDIIETIEDEGSLCTRIGVHSGEVLTFEAIGASENNPFVEILILDRNGNRVTFGQIMLRADDPLQLSHYFAEGGTYFARVIYSDHDTPLTLRLTAGVPNEGLADAKLLEPNETIRDELTEIRQFKSRSFNLETAGSSYYIEGKAGDVVTIEAKAASQGSQIETIGLSLYNLNFDRLRVSDVSGGEIDAGISTTLPADGRYYLLLDGGTPGEQATHFYELTLTVESSE